MMVLQYLSVLAIVISVVVAKPIGDPSDRCPADVIYVVDQSTSVTATSYKSQVIPFLVNVTNALNIGADDDHVAFVHFASPSTTDVSFYLNDSFASDQIVQDLKKQPFTGGSTATAKALTLVHDQVLTALHGARMDRYQSKTVAPVVLIITDGAATDSDPSIPAEALRSNGVTIFAIGVGPAITKSYLVGIAGSEANVVCVTDFSNLDDKLIESIQASTKCE